MFLAAVIFTLVLALVVAAPATWILMLFLGNLGLKMSFFACLPGGILVGMIRGGVEIKK